MFDVAKWSIQACCLPDIIIIFFLSFQKGSLKKSFYGDNDIYGFNGDNALEHMSVYKA